MFSLWLSSAAGQLIPYEGPARWMPYQGAHEQFYYQQNDSLGKPEGIYRWQCQREQGRTGQYELASLQAEFKNGLAEGPMEFLHYHLSFSIESFDKKQVKAESLGNKTLIQGQFRAGKPIGTWVFSFGPMNEEQLSGQLHFDLNSRQLTYKSDSLQFSGTVNEEGFFHGDWTWSTPELDSLQLRYQQGILTRLADTTGSRFEMEFARELRFFAALDSLAAAPVASPWIWNPGCTDSDSIVLLQQPVSGGFRQALKPYEHGFDYLSLHPLLDLPPISGITRFYHPLPAEQQRLLYDADATIQIFLQSLHWKLETPSFQLRRSGNPKVDSLMHAAEALMEQAYALQEHLLFFLGDEARFVSPYFLPMTETQPVDSHEAYARLLLGKTENLGAQTDSLLLLLDQKLDILRLRGNLEDLEQEWHQLQQSMSVYLCDMEEPHGFIRRIYSRYIENDHDARTRAYGSIETLTERQAFLQETLEYNQFFYDFLIQEKYAPILELDLFLQKHYTQYLYNPYMAVNNIEVVVKPRFLQVVLDRFWPYLIQSLELAPDGYAFQARYQEVMKLRAILQSLAYDKSSPAKRLARKGRKTERMEALEILLRDYASIKP